MENIINLFSIVGILILLGIGIVILLYPIMFEIKFRESFGQKGFSYGWAAVQIIGMLGTMSYAHDTSSDGFSEALGFTVIIFTVAMVKNYKRVKKMGLTKYVCKMAVLAQMMAPVGIIFIVILLSSFFNSITKDDEKKN